jgi:hypothetical protein
VEASSFELSSALEVGCVGVVGFEVLLLSLGDGAIRGTVSSTAAKGASGINRGMDVG